MQVPGVPGRVEHQTEAVGAACRLGQDTFGPHRAPGADHPHRRSERGGVGQVTRRMGRTRSAQHTGQPVRLEHVGAHERQCQHRQVDPTAAERADRLDQGPTHGSGCRRAERDAGTLGHGGGRQDRTGPARDVVQRVRPEVVGGAEEREGHAADRSGQRNLGTGDPRAAALRGLHERCPGQALDGRRRNLGVPTGLGQRSYGRGRLHADIDQSARGRHHQTDPHPPIRWSQREDQVRVDVHLDGLRGAAPGGRGRDGEGHLATQAHPSGRPSTRSGSRCRPRGRLSGRPRRPIRGSGSAHPGCGTRV